MISGIDIAALAIAVPLSAIVLGIGSGIVQSILKSQERRIELRLKAQKGQNGETIKQLEALRTEIAALRDTTTQYDLTNDKIVERLEERLGRIEAKSAQRYTPEAAPEDVIQRNGLG